MESQNEGQKRNALKIEKQNHFKNKLKTFVPSGLGLVVKGSQLWVPPWVRFPLATQSVLSGKKTRILRTS